MQITTQQILPITHQPIPFIKLLQHKLTPPQSLLIHMQKITNINQSPHQVTNQHNPSTSTTPSLQTTNQLQNHKLHQQKKQTFKMILPNQQH